MAERDALRIRVDEFEADLREGALTYEHLREG